MKKMLSLAIIVLLLLSVEVFSLPRFGLKLNDRCISCHVNPTGGGMRNENGFFFGKNVVSLISPREKDFPISPKLTENVSFGLDYRSQYLYSEEKKRTDFHDMTGSIYLNASVSKDIDILARYDFVQSIWEGFGIARILPNESYIKVGSFVPYFGIRIDDHTSYTKGGDFGLLFSTGAIQGLPYNPFYLETGIELGLNLIDNALLTASVGKSKFNPIFSTDPTFTTRFEIMPAINKMRFLFGGSYSTAKTRNLGTYLSTKLYGGFAGFGYDRFAIIGEYDVADNYVAPGTNSNAFMIEASYQLMIGLEGIVRYDKFDPNVDLKDDEHAHLIFGFEFFPYSFIELRPQYRIQIENPDVKNNSFVLQFHFWY